ncbi:MAG: rod shape-determining protein [Clostridia bacterium]|nr:rod shape-determining protein [Clostridia bacterium]
MARIIGIDLGTSNTYIYRKGRGIVVREPSVIAIDEEKSRVVALGEDAYNMIGKEPAGVKAVKPIKDGVISEFDITVAMLHGFFVKASGKGSLNRPNVVLAVSNSITEVEKRALEEAAAEAGARSVAIIPSPFAAAMGAGLPIEEPRGNMIVNIGGGTTDVAVLSLGGIIQSNSVRVGGDEIDEAIAAYLKRKHNLIVTLTDAEELKRTLGTLSLTSEEKTQEIYGRDAASGLPLTITVKNTELKEPIEEQLSKITECIKATLEKLHPELSADIYEYGLTLSGGGALIDGIQEYYSKMFGFEVKCAQNPLDCCVVGIQKIIELLPDAISFNEK